MFEWRRALAPLGPVLVALACVGLVACAELPPLEAGSCGNGVVDPGEDCDGVSAFPGEPNTACEGPGDAHPCSQVCGGDAICPAGWGCGGDGVCRYASGSYRGDDTPAIGAGFIFMTVGDSDGDGHPDLVGQTLSGNLEAWYGEGSGRFGSPAVLSAGSIAGLPDFGQLDTEDDLVDAVIPQPQGIFVVRSSGDRSFAPVAYPAVELPMSIDGVALEDVRALNLSLVPYVSHGGALFQAPSPTGSQIILNIFDIASVGEAAAIVPTAGKLVDQVSAPLARNLDVIPAGIDAETAGRLRQDELVLGFAGDDRIHLFRFVADGLAYQPVPLPAAVLPGGLVLAHAADGEGDGLGPFAGGFGLGQIVESRGFHLGDVDGDGDLDLLARATATVGGPGSRVVLFLANGDGTFGAGVVDTRFSDLLVQPAACPFPEAVSTTRWPIAVGDVNGDGVAEFVGTGGIYVATELGLCAITPGTAAWSEALIDDFNRDAFPDVAAVSLLTRQVEFRIGTATGLFNRFSVPTESPPTRLRSGDFDGDLVRDLAVVELDQLAGASEESLSVLFGDTQGAPSAPVSMGRLDQILSIEPGSSPFDLAGLDATTDLLIQSRPLFQPESSSGIAIMVGTSQRRMLSPLTISVAGPETRRAPLAVRIGRFLDAAGTADEFADLLVIALAPLANPGVALEAWVVNAAPLGPDFQTQPPHEASFDCTREAFDVHCATFATGDLDVIGDGPLVEAGADEIIGIDGTCDAAIAEGRASRLAIFRMSFEAGAVRLPCATLDLPAELDGPLAPRLADVDHDGDLDAVIVFGGVRGGGSEQVGRAIVIYPNEGGSFGAPTTEPIVGATGELLDAGVLNSDADPELEVVVLAHDGVWLHDAEAGLQQVIFRPLDAGRLTIADVDEDGLDDVLISDFFQTYVYRASSGKTSGMTEPQPVPDIGAP